VSEGPDLALQGAIVAKLKADMALQSLIGNPPSWTLAYVTIGEGQNVPDQVQCIDGSEIFLDVHVWSRATGFGECKRIAAVIESALNNTDLTLDDNRCVEIERDGARYLRDQDLVTKHGVITFRALTEPA
jgi:hypothetical protein